MEFYNDSFMGGTPVTLDNGLIEFAQKHVVATLIFAVIGLIAIIFVIGYLIIKTYSAIFGNSDSFVGTYMPWRPNVQDRSEINAIIDANKLSPPIQFPAGLLKNGVDPDSVESNLGSY